MPFAPKNDLETIDHIISIGLEDNILSWLDYKALEPFFIDSYSSELSRVIRKMKTLNLISKHDKIKELWNISDYARELTNEYGSYSNYVSNNLEIEKKKSKAVFFDRLFQNGNIIAVFVISLLTLVLTQIQLYQNKDQPKTEQRLESVLKELDSVKYFLRTKSIHSPQ